MKQNNKTKLENITTGATNFATNLGLATMGMEGIEYLDKLGYSSSTQALSIAGAIGGIYALNKSGLIKKFSKKINQTSKNNLASYFKAGVLAGAIGLGAYLNTNNINEISKDIHKTILKEENVKEILTGSSRLTTSGKFYRTYRWDNYIDEIEEKYNIEKGLIGGLIMRESYGNPIQLNAGNDGGAGLMMFQPGTAKYYNLKVYGKSNKTGRDKEHGKELLELVEKYNYDYNELSKIDDRFNGPKSIEAGARFLRDLKNRFGTWDRALSAYNRGTPAKEPRKTNHVKKVREYQQYYNIRDKN